MCLFAGGLDKRFVQVGKLFLKGPLTRAGGPLVVTMASLKKNMQLRVGVLVVVGGYPKWLFFGGVIFFFGGVV